MMGHERIGFLSHTKQWQGIVDQLASFGGREISIAQVANETLNTVKNTYKAMPLSSIIGTIKGYCRKWYLFFAFLLIVQIRG